MVTFETKKNGESAGKWQMNVVLTAMSLLSVFILLEILLRIFGPRYCRFNNTTDVYYTNPRGYHSIIGREGEHVLYGIPYENSREGFRLPDRNSGSTVRKKFADRKKKILAVGDSFTYGYGVKYGDIFPTQLENLFEKKQGVPIGIANRARGGFDLEEIFFSLVDAFSQQHYPLVLYGFVLNDFGLINKGQIKGFDYIDFNNGGNRFNFWRKKLAIVNFIAHRIDQHRLSHITQQAYLKAHLGENAEKKFTFLAEMNSYIKGRGSEMILVLFPLLYDFDNYPFQSIHDRMISFCRQENIKSLDLLPLFSSYDARDLIVHPNDHHPNEIAHRIAAEAIYAFMLKNSLTDNIFGEQTM